jgi:hypothetical protein
MYHCLSCSRCHKEVYQRHDRTRDAIIDFIGSNVSGAVIEYERMIYSADDADTHQRADFTLQLPNSERMIIDVMITNTGAPTYHALQPESMLNRAEQYKDRTYRDTIQDPENLIPFIMLTTGNIGNRASNWMDTIGAQSQLGKDLFKTYLLRRLSVALANSLYASITAFGSLILPPRLNMGARRE